MSSPHALTSTQLSQFLKDFGPPYFDHVLAEYELVCSDPGIPPRVQEIIQKHRSGDKVTWGELYLLEKYVVYKQSEEVLRARLPGLRLNYREIVGSEAYEQYLQSRQAASLDDRIEELRADAGRLLDALHWAYAMAPEREQMRSNILKTIAKEILVSVIVAMAITCSAYYYLGRQTQLTTVTFVLLMGALGGFFSVQRRIENIPTQQDPILTMFQLQNGRFSVHLAPLTGAICALILFLIFQAALITGAAFPNVGMLPAPAEYGKLLVWSFIAGFAERFVPDTLDNLIPNHGETTPGKEVTMVSVGQRKPNDVARKSSVSIDEHRAA
jgi:hypothetical protein